MITLSDTTINDALGVYQRVKDIMLVEEGLSAWMLRSSATVVMPECVGSFLLHAWDNGDLIIQESDHPPLISVPDMDLRELKRWSEEGGWRLCVASRLLADPSSFQFWLQKYRETLIYSHELEKYENEESSRMSAALESERSDEQKPIGDTNVD